MVKIDRIEHAIDLPDGVSASIDDGVLTVKGPNGELSRAFQSSRVKLLQDGAGLLVRIDLPRRKEKALAGTWNAHIKNMVKGVTDGFSYTLRCFYSHFPMTMKVQGSEFVVNNYFGERVPRRADILTGVNVRVENKTDVIVSGIDKEAVGQTAANIERCTTVKNRDRRVFQDGIYRVAKE
ncbi:MAG TPA: 50S ribosomal protein L6 [Candidatus Poseidoniaceae archaeon]|nr:MAG TPA: 50S ribosomal protein L6 [Candidatus Poseidoniales archaeon]HIH52690.1 50S ribosomal protein L6 [Candidatus Poseidoniaceae archaeon]